MSAILAVFHRDGSTVNPEILNFMLGASQYRAVHGQHIWLNGNIALANQHFLLTPEDQGLIQPLSSFRVRSC